MQSMLVVGSIVKDEQFYNELVLTALNINNKLINLNNFVKLMQI